MMAKQRVADLHVEVPDADQSFGKPQLVSNANSEGSMLRSHNSLVNRLRGEESLSPSSLATPGVPKLPSTSIFKMDREAFSQEFLVQKRVGAGGFAEVFIAQHGGRTIALKLLRIDDTSHAKENTVMFFKEARALRNCCSHQ